MLRRNCLSALPQWSAGRGHKEAGLQSQTFKIGFPQLSVASDLMGSEIIYLRRTGSENRYYQTRIRIWAESSGSLILKIRQLQIRHSF
jgi:hypothetical protein